LNKVRENVREQGNGASTGCQKEESPPARQRCLVAIVWNHHTLRLKTETPVQLLLKAGPDLPVERPLARGR
jgi:hypothetical protein